MYYVKFDQMFENNTHWSNFDVWACCVKVVNTVENKIYLNDSCTHALWSLSNCLKILPIGARLTCERDLWSSSECLRVIAIYAILMCKRALCNLLTCLSLIPLFRNYGVQSWYVKFVVIIMNNIYRSDSDMWVGSVNFLEMIEINTHMSDSVM